MVVVDVVVLVLVDAVVLEIREQKFGEPATPVEGAVACEVDPDIVDNEPRPVVPRPVVPRPLVPRPATPTPAASGLEFAAVVELTGLGERDDGEEAFPLVDVAVRELVGPLTPELLTELHGAAVSAWQVSARARWRRASWLPRGQISCQCPLFPWRSSRQGAVVAGPLVR
jgi:hypothetical protein